MTGSEGFVGGHLVPYLKARLDHVVATYHRLPREKIEGVNYVYLDVCRKEIIEKVLTSFFPDFIFHLAAKSSPPLSFLHPQRTFLVNINGALNLYESVREVKERNKFYDPLILQAGSSEAFGLVKKEEIPISESQPFRPVSPYGASKAAISLIGYQYFKSFGLKIIRLNLFTHTGPGQRKGFFVPDVASQIAELEKRGRGELHVGNLNSIRDYSDVRDIISAYWLAAMKCQPGEVYNVCSGKKTPIKEILRILVSFSRAKITVTVDPTKFRKVETPLFVGNPAKFKKQTLWENKIPLRKTLTDTLNWWRGTLP